MTTLLLDKNNNLVYANTFSLATGNIALAQDIKTRLGMWRSEYPFDSSAGVDYKTLLVENNNKLLESEILNEIRKDERVASAEVESLKMDGGRLTLSIKIENLDGEQIDV